MESLQLESILEGRNSQPHQLIEEGVTASPIN